MSDFFRWLRDGREFLPGITAAALLGLLVFLLPLPVTPGATGAAGALPGPTGGSVGPLAPTTGQSGATAAGQVQGPAGGSSGGLTGLTGAGAGPAGGAGGAGGAGAKVGAGGVFNGGSTYQGVTATTVKWGFSAQTEGCGGFSQAQVAAAYGFASNDYNDYQMAEKYFNEYPLTNVPLPPVIRAHVNPRDGYWGRHIISVFRDSGGFACPEVGRANAVRMAEQDKVFGLIQRGNEGPEPDMSLVMAQHHLIAIGRQNTSPSYFTDRAPYFWDGYWGDGATENIALGSWICRDWKGRPASNTGDPTVSGLPRKFGMLFPDIAGFHELAGILQQELNTCGLLNVAQYTYPFDLQTLESSAQTVIARMHADGVTTVLSIADFFSTLALTQAATNQDYHPEWVRSGWGMGGYPAEYQTFMTKDQAANSWAAADNASIATPAYGHSESYLAWKKVSPSTEPDSDWDVYYYQFKLAALGMAGAGPDLTPTTFGQGIARLCDPCYRSNPLLPLFEAYPGHYANRLGFTLVKWDPNKADPIDTRNSNGQQPQGYFDFLENGKRYLATISQPDNLGTG